MAAPCIIIFPCATHPVNPAQKLKSGKAHGPDQTPIEQFKSSDSATYELFHLLSSIFETETIPADFALADMLMQYKKKNRDDRGNYRALGLLNHAFKVFGMILLIRIFPFIMPKLSDMQAGFRKERGCRDNILILVMVIQHLLKNSDDGEYILKNNDDADDMLRKVSEMPS